MIYEMNEIMEFIEERQNKFRDICPFIRKWKSNEYLIALQSKLGEIFDHQKMINLGMEGKNKSDMAILIGDLFVYCFLVASELKLDPEAIIIQSFNIKSTEINSDLL
jgi:hypothetical protein